MAVLGALQRAEMVTAAIQLISHATLLVNGKANSLAKVCKTLSLPPFKRLLTRVFVLHEICCFFPPAVDCGPQIN